MEHVSLARFAYGRHFENEIPLFINRGREMSPISGNALFALFLTLERFIIIRIKLLKRVYIMQILQLNLYSLKTITVKIFLASAKKGVSYHGQEPKKVKFLRVISLLIEY